MSSRWDWDGRSNTSKLFHNILVHDKADTEMRGTQENKEPSGPLRRGRSPAPNDPEMKEVEILQEKADEPHEQ